MTENDIEGPGKGKTFFERAHTVAESGNHDYAIDMFIEGLKREPQNVQEHQALLQVAAARKMKGGKPAGGLFGAKGPLKGKTPKDLMLNAEWLLAKDSGNLTHFMTMLRQAAVAPYADVIRWIGPLVIVASKQKPKKDIYLELADIYEAIGEFRRASEAVQQAIELDPTNMALIAQAKDLAAKETLAKGKYETTEDFKESLKDREQTKELLEDENLQKSTDYRVRLVDNTKKDYEANPTEVQVIVKYAKALTDMDSEESENQAIAVLQKAFEQTKVYRFKVTVGDIRMKQFKRNISTLRDAVKSNPGDKTHVEQLRNAETERLAFELEEYKDRAAHFPTDMLILFEYGSRLYRSKQFDEAMKILQVAQNHPKHRAAALHLLGRCFMEQSMMHEAVDTLKKAIDSYELAETGDAKSKEFHYWLARAYEETNRPQEAIQICSKIMQWDVSFKDVRARLDGLRKKASGAV